MSIIPGYRLVTVMILLSVLATGCRPDAKPSGKPTPYQIVIPKYFPTDINIPADNPETVEGIALGRYLFYDGRLSGRTSPDSLMSCGTCHLQSRAFECGIDNPRFTGGHPFGLKGVMTPHVMLPLMNLIFNNNGYFWNGVIHPSNPDPNRRTIEDVVYMGLVAPHEMGGDSTRTVKLIQQIPGYPDLFFKAFGSSKVTFKNISRAIAQFVRTLISSNSKFDKYLRGEVALSDDELGGLGVFTTENGGDCFHCHGSGGNPLFTTNLFYNNGKQSDFTGANDDPRDRYHVTGNPMDIGAYRAPSLRNIDLTGPYMHDGRFKTLDDVLDFYSTGVVASPYISPLMHHVNTGGVRLTPPQKQMLKSFLMTLHDDDFITNPKYAKPSRFPDGSAQ
ncbi:MAG: cytochrome c peroxidase [Bacteroidota bacterium]|nr:cytochrome c peroxidase [Bacteroidota bacterium]